MRLSSAIVQADLPAAVLAQVVESKLIDADAAGRLQQLLAREGRDLPALVAAGDRVPLHWFRELYPALDADTAARIGYAAGEQARLTSFAALSLPLVSAGSVSEVLRLLEFMPLISSSVTARFLTRADDVVVVIRAGSGDPVLDRFPVFYCASAVQRLLTILVAGSPRLDIHIAWPQPACLADHPGVQAGRLHFDAPFHHLVVPNETMAAVCRFSDPIAYQGALAGLLLRLRAVSSDETVGRLKALLDGPDHRVGIDEAARALHLSVSSLKRRLAEAGTSFRALRDEALQQRALMLLAEPSASLASVGAELGYGDLANFAHAFKRWTGQSPGAFRRRLALRA
ncbi:MAG: AraC family transcriptional regulator [Xanthomonadaceae bacterium]|nr:AraC family transcriptional regulator [Xanthomonadaceae bacterium]